MKVDTNFNTMRTPHYIFKNLRTPSSFISNLRTPKMACVHLKFVLQILSIHTYV